MTAAIKREKTERAKILSARLPSIDGTVDNAIEVVSDITERRRAEKALRESEAQLSNALKMAHAGNWEYDVGRDVFKFNDNFYRIFRTTAAEVGSYRMSSADYARRFCHPEDAGLVGNAVRAAIETTDPNYDCQIEHRILYADGEVGYITVRFFIVKDSEGRTVKTYGVNQDITERKQAEEEHKQLQDQLLQSQKMESIGRLAGGVAHDFNNLLTVILSSCAFMAEGLHEEDPLLEDVRQIDDAGKRAAALTRQLLAFSRRQMLQTEVLNLNWNLKNLDRMLGRLIGEDIDIAIEMAPNIWKVEADPGQIEQIVLNLAVNARDAMPTGGKLTIETANVVLDEEYALNHVAVTSGPYVMLAVSDTGGGMDDETTAQVFEPFFTTKEKDKGTGLGLSMVYGIVKQHGGNVWVYSEPGKGTTFKIYLPRSSATEITVSRIPDSIADTRGTETVLVVEDAAAVLKLAVRVLKNKGYKVLAARDGLDGQSMANAHEGPIHLLLTDVVMPKMNGRELAEKLLATRPELKVLYMSGYTDNAIVKHGVLEKGAHFMQKPFSVELLARKVRGVLDDRLLAG